MKRKWFFLLIIVLSLCGASIFIAQNADPDIVLPVKLKCTAKPIVELSIQNNRVGLLVDLGLEDHMILDKQVLVMIKKQPIGIFNYCDFLGNNYESSCYSISNIKVGNRMLNNVIVHETNDELASHAILGSGATRSMPGVFKSCNPRLSCQGSVGVSFFTKLFDGYNILLDFLNLRLILCKKWPSKYLLHQKMTKVPFQIGESGIIFLADTDLGRKAFCLDTGCTQTVLRSSLFKGRSCSTNWAGIPFLTTSKFMIGGKDFGRMDLSACKLDKNLHRIDGVLGMEFMLTHAVYIDFEHHQLYISECLN